MKSIQDFSPTSHVALFQLCRSLLTISCYTKYIHVQDIKCANNGLNSLIVLESHHSNVALWMAIVSLNSY